MDEPTHVSSTRDAYDATADLYAVRIGTEIQGRPVSITNHRHSPEVVAEALRRTGFDLTARVVREPWAPHEVTPQAFLFAVARPSPDPL